MTDFIWYHFYWNDIGHYARDYETRFFQVYENKFSAFIFYRLNCIVTIMK